ncbi:hypothetical protein PAXRUDRAFT_531673 [Paxillus rubicundulus Ve08.2h10]|uniref:Uncharacterized protein n=1 Tax=Paxillus rubicundulus Ve08.2h10 TaxID=930991 RepID=A0A0D0E097_9AGAM|nr:hypothetical protein PAXRUDRAFT_531673 [Paxillus rubicundulus Ve08.2h10]
MESAQGRSSPLADLRAHASKQPGQGQQHTRHAQHEDACRHQRCVTNCKQSARSGLQICMMLCKVVGSMDYQQGKNHGKAIRRSICCEEVIDREFEACLTLQVFRFIPRQVSVTMAEKTNFPGILASLKFCHLSNVGFPKPIVRSSGHRTIGPTVHS